MTKNELLESLQRSTPDSYLPVKAVIKMIKQIDSDTVTADHVQLVTENVLAELVKDGTIKKMVRKVITSPDAKFPFKKYLRRGDVGEIAKMAHVHQTYVSAILNGRRKQPKILAMAERFVKEKYNVQVGKK